MAKYLLIESRDPFESGDVDYYYGLAEGLAKDGNDVTLFLVQNGVLPARRSSKTEALERVSAAGVKICADEFSLKERGISEQRLAACVSSSPLELVVDHMAEGSKTLWH